MKLVNTLIKMNKRVVLDFDIVGFHQWKEAIPEVDFLKHKHRHLFQIRIHIDVSHNNREKEIFIETDKAVFYLTESYGTPCNFYSMSCEDIAQELLEYGMEDGYVKVEVYEDRKGGAIVSL